MKYTGKYATIVSFIQRTSNMKEKELAHAAKIYIRRCPAEEIGTLSVTKIAEKFNTNLSFLSRSFNKYRGLKLFDFLELYKMIRFEDVAGDLEEPTVSEMR